LIHSIAIAKPNDFAMPPKHCFGGCKLLLTSACTAIGQNQLNPLNNTYKLCLCVAYTKRQTLTQNFERVVILNKFNLVSEREIALKKLFLQKGKNILFHQKTLIFFY